METLFAKPPAFEIIYARQPLPEMNSQFIRPKSLFLIGPTSMEPEIVPSWRGDALDFLRGEGFNGPVLVPEDDSWGLSDENFRDQTRWEWHAILGAAAIAIWLPRDLNRTPKGWLKMPAFTSNVEFGIVLGLLSRRVVLGYPKEAPKMKYMHQAANEFYQIAREYGFDIAQIPVFHTMEDTLRAAMNIAAQTA